MNKTKLIFLLLIFLLGIFFYSTKVKNIVENFEVKNCPNVLIKKGKELHLVNTKT